MHFTVHWFKTIKARILTASWSASNCFQEKSQKGPKGFLFLRTGGSINELSEMPGSPGSQPHPGRLHRFDSAARKL